jgi:hypothetical protein
MLMRTWPSSEGVVAVKKEPHKQKKRNKMKRPAECGDRFMPAWGCTEQARQAAPSNSTLPDSERTGMGSSNVVKKRLE